MCMCTLACPGRFPHGPASHAGCRRQDPLSECCYPPLRRQALRYANPYLMGATPGSAVPSSFNGSFLADRRLILGHEGSFLLILLSHAASAGVWSKPNIHCAILSDNSTFRHPTALRRISRGFMRAGMAMRDQVPGISNGEGFDRPGGCTVSLVLGDMRGVGGSRLPPCGL